MNFHRMLSISYVRRSSFHLEAISYLVMFARSQSSSVACISHVGLFLCVSCNTDYTPWSPKEKEDRFTWQKQNRRKALQSSVFLWSISGGKLIPKESESVSLLYHSLTLNELQNIDTMFITLKHSWEDGYLKNVQYKVHCIMLA